jgi:hypothetical protein
LTLESLYVWIKHNQVFQQDTCLGLVGTGCRFGYKAATAQGSRGTCQELHVFSHIPPVPLTNKILSNEFLFTSPRINLLRRPRIGCKKQQAGGHDGVVYHNFHVFCGLEFVMPFYWILR